MTWRGHEVGDTREKKGIKQSSIQPGLKKNSIHNTTIIIGVLRLTYSCCNWSAFKSGEK